MKLVNKFFLLVKIQNYRSFMHFQLIFFLSHKIISWELQIYPFNNC